MRSLERRGGPASCVFQVDRAIAEAIIYHC